MHYSAFILSALSIGSAFATGVTVHVVRVGAADGSLVFQPNSVSAATGDVVQFQFGPKNHTVTQSTFDKPCQPIAMNSNVTGIFSGFMPVSAADTSVPTYSVVVNSSTPMWLYCSQGKHCQSGMVMVINENPTANSTRTLQNYQNLASQATANLAPGGSSSDGTTGSIPANGSTATTAAGTATATGTATSTSTTGVVQATSSFGQSAYEAPASVTLCGLLALGMLLFA